MDNFNLTDDECKSLQSANGESEWHQAVTDIKDARNGEYPPDWYKKVISGNLQNSSVALGLELEEVYIV